MAQGVRVHPVGDTVERSFGPDLQSESAIAIQADPRLANGATISLVGNTLPFDGLPGHYQMVTGQLQGDFAYTSLLTPPFHTGAVIFLTLDVFTGNFNNDTTAVALDFFNFNEVPVSTEFSFTCWGQVELSALDPNLTVELGGTFGGTTRHDKGIFISGQAIDASTGLPRTLLGLVQVAEGPVAGPANAVTSYSIRPGNNSIPVPTIFWPVIP